MRTHWGSQVMMLMVVLLALAPAGARGQSQPAGIVGSGVVPPSAGANYSANPVESGRMPLPAAQSQVGFGPGAPYAGIAPPAYPPGAYGYPPLGNAPAGVSLANYSPYSGGPQPYAGPPEEAMGAGMYDAQMASYLAEGACSNCGGSGCPDCLGLRGLVGRGLSWILPYADGGTCAQRWYDITAEWVSLRREDVSRRINFATAGIVPDPDPTPFVVLSTEDLDFDTSGAFQLRGAFQIFAGSAVEFTYLGLNNWDSSAEVVDPTGDLFSVISDFGTDPFGGFDETDFSQFQSIAYSSSIDSFELHFRKRWIAPNCRLQGSWLAGARYLYLLEDFRYLTIGANDPLTGFPVGGMIYDVRTKNSVTGFQLGGDLWTSVVPGISLGGELKAGIYGNYAQQGSHIIATTTNLQFAQDASVSDTSGGATFVGQGNLMLVYKTSPNWAIRAGYTFLYVDGVALAPENFDPNPPLFNPDPAPANVNKNGSVLYHGFTLGLEWMW